MQPIQAADYHDIAKPSDPQLSPTGDHVAFVRTIPDDEESAESTVYLVPTDGSSTARRFSLAEGVDAEPRWSPSGDRLAFTSTRGADDDRQQLWVLPVDGGEAEQVTNVAGGVSAIAWSPDGTRIAFVQSVSDEEREEDLDLAVEEDYDPDPPDPRVIDRTVFRSMQKYFDGRRSHVYVVDLEGSDDSTDRESKDTGSTNTDSTDTDSNKTDSPETDSAKTDPEYPISRITPNVEPDADFTSPTWSEETTLYFIQSVGDDPDDSLEYDILAYDTDADSVDCLHRTTGWGNGLEATTDGSIAFAHIIPEQASLQQTNLHVIDAEQAAAVDDSAEVDVVDVTANLDRTLGFEATPRWGPDEETLYFTTPDEGKTAVWSVPGDGSADPKRLARNGTVVGMDVGVSPGVETPETGMTSTDGGSNTPGSDSESGPITLAVAMSQWNHPGDVFVTTGSIEEPDGLDEPTRLTRLNEAYLDSVHVGEPESHTFESEQGEFDGWVLTPPEFDPEKMYPLIAEVHGGPHAMWSTAGTMWHEFQTLAARGYVVFWSNPRGSTGYGEAFMTAIERDWGDVTLTDVMAGVESVADREYIDEENVFLTGGSFGGYMTGWAVGNTDYFEAAVSQRGVYDLTGFYGSTDGAYKLVEGDFDTTPWAEPEFLWNQSPAGHAHEVDTPTLVLHSDDDYRTPICNAELFHRILRKHDVETRFVRYPREGHELSRSGEPGHVVDRIERIARWFDGYSNYHDVPKALDRGDDGLTAGDTGDSTDAA